jgi:hypothetical protein
LYQNSRTLMTMKLDSGISGCLINMKTIDLKVDLDVESRGTNIFATLTGGKILSIVRDIQDTYARSMMT